VSVVTSDHDAGALQGATHSQFANAFGVGMPPGERELAAAFGVRTIDAW
jgi:hypothetical protein